MIIFIITLLLSAVNNGSMSDGVSDVIRDISHGQARTEENVDNVASGEIQEIAKDATMQKFRKELERVEDTVLKTLELSPERINAFNERLKELRTFKQDKVNKDGDSITEINERAGVAKDLFQSDILLTETQAKEIIEDIEKEARENTRTKRQAYRDSRYPDTLWSNGVNYYFHPYASYETQRVFMKGAELWQKDTCIDFRYDSTAADRILVAPGNGNGCWSNIGKVGGQQVILLGRKCEMVHIAAHEIGHALGFYHTMSRHDRDYHVIIDTWSIMPGWTGQYSKETTDTNDNYGMPYDAGSIMHYGMRSSSANTRPTIVPYDMKHQKTLGSPFISFIDLSMMNEHYNCKALCNSSTSVTCERGGFPHPRDCRKCICPGGYGGARCTERPEGCGRRIQASEEWETLNDTLGESWTTREDFMKCHYWIESPENTTIEVELLDFTKNFAIDGCIYAGVEIKTIEDQTLTGYRFCAPEDAGMYLRSFSNLVPIMTYNRVGVTTTSLKYRYIPTNSPSATTAPSSPLSTSSEPSHSSSSTATHPPATFTTTKRAAPSTSRTTARPTATTKGGRTIKCVDSPKCASVVKDGFCEMSFPKRTKMKLCPVSCGFC